MSETRTVYSGNASTATTDGPQTMYVPIPRSCCAPVIVLTPERVDALARAVHRKRPTVVDLLKLADALSIKIAIGLKPA